MLIVADSGSTKCDWRLIKEDRSAIDFKTMGINPFFHNEVLIENELRRVEEVKEHKDDVFSVFFYGAGCSSENYKEIVARGLKRVFKNAEINVSHDLDGAAFATWQNEPAIACILGTGSNSCFFDGISVTEAVPALGYILGDEGSGAYFGKKLMADYLYNRLPSDISGGLEDQLGLNKTTIFENVYQKEHANVYLASFMKFLGNYKESDYVKKMMFDGFVDFLNKHVKCFENYEDVKTHFIGSVAHHYSEFLESACAREKVNLGVIIKKPIDGLVDYHFKYLHQKIKF